ncbi:hypothetical protein APHAL10511_000698 [Amanita phalloides]|nr:hypothetical protein APHAL10511_000698 [Amanita phalloides]
MDMKHALVHEHLEELQLIKCSLLPNEILKFIEDDSDDILWARLSDAYDNGATMPFFPDGAPIPDEQAGSSPTTVPARPARFRIEVDPCPGRHDDGRRQKVGFEVVMPSLAESFLNRVAAVSAKGDFLGRVEQERWRNVVKEKTRMVEDTQYPTYELLSFHLLPLLHEHDQNADESLDARRPERSDGVHNMEQDEVAARMRSEKAPLPAQTYHALLTSHHLVSPQKRRSLHEWSSSLGVSGFAKVGYPGVIYAQGERQPVETFVANVKSMQWLALRVRFVEPVGHVTDELGGMDDSLGRDKMWKEFQKVGEVVEEMKRLGRRKYVTEVGIGNARAR